MKVFIIEDDEVLSEAYKKVLQGEGCITKIAYACNEAIEMLKDFKPSIILLDLHMLCCLEFLRMYKSQKGPKAKVIVFSNVDKQIEVDKVYELGADHFIAKSWTSPNNLIALIRGMAKASQTGC